MTAKPDKTLLLLKPRGFCAGVVRAIDIVRIALDAFGPPIYVRKEIVHNRYVVEDLKEKGDLLCPRCGAQRARGKQAARPQSD
jgi:4-hydroxy-3-methylbut-2-enyl diphosphate reductase